MDPHAQENKSATVEEVDVDIGFQVSNIRFRQSRISTR
jgi:hypothetical protein